MCRTWYGRRNRRVVLHEISHYYIILLLVAGLIIVLIGIDDRMREERANHAVGLCATAASIVVLLVTLGLVTHGYYTCKYPDKSASEAESTAEVSPE